jgi:hypothetical protein
MLSVSFDIKETGGGLKKLAQMVSPIFWGRVLKSASPNIMMDVGNLYMDRVRTTILQGKALGPPLSPEWAARKGNDIPWLASGWLLAQMQVKAVQGRQVIAGFSGGRAAEEAMRCEHGTTRQPGRAVLEPEAKKLRGEYRLVGSIVKKNIRKQMLKHGVKI